MPCYRPIAGWRSRQVSSSGRRRIVFNPSDGYKDLPVQIPCGQCIGCRLDRSRQWALRCCQEAKLHVFNSFITLTFDDEHLPKDNSLSKRELQLFFKSLRKEIEKNEPGKKIRYYACGEYGETGDRPHYHAIIFGHDFDDKQYIKSINGNRLYTSDTLSSVWGKGFVTIGNVSFDSAAYVARYCTKKITGDKAESHYNGRQPEFSLMSTGRESGGGIGGPYFKKFYSDFERADGRILHDGRLLKPARYYNKIYDSITEGDINYDKSKHKRIVDKLKKDNTPDRLAVKERLQEYKLRQMKLNKGCL